jgi:hypothetical protein
MKNAPRYILILILESEGGRSRSRSKDNNKIDLREITCCSVCCCICPYQDWDQRDIFCYDSSQLKILGSCSLDCQVTIVWTAR